MSDITTQKYTTSTYLIDASKKIFISGTTIKEETKIIDGEKKRVYTDVPTTPAIFPDNDNVPDTLKGMPVFAAGIIDDKALQNLGFEYKEGFTSGKKVAEDRFEDVIKPATMAVKALTSALPIMKGVGSRVDSAEKLRTTAIEGYTLLAGTTTLLGNSNTDTSVTEQLDKWQAVYQYDPPVRKGPPSVDFQSNQIDITFRYGACNVFDAFWEVYYPITKIYESLFPRANSVGNGLANYTQQFRVPYEQQVFVELLKNILKVEPTKKVKDGKKTRIEPNVENIFVDLRELASAKSTLDREADLFEERKNNLINGLDSSLNGLQIKDVINQKDYAKDIKTKIFDAVGLGDIKESDIQTALTAGDDEGSLYSAISGLIETEIEKKRMKGDILITDGKWKGGNGVGDKIVAGAVNIINTIGNRFGTSVSTDLKSRLPSDSGGIKVIEKTNNGKSSKAATLKNVFNNLVTFEPRMIGQTLSNIYSNWIKYCCSDIYFGFPCVYGRSLSDFKDTIYRYPGAYAKIHIQNIVLANVAISFNFSNTDERGYPLEGHVILKGMWNCALPQNVLTFENGNSPKDTIKMEGQS